MKCLRLRVERMGACTPLRDQDKGSVETGTGNVLMEAPPVSLLTVGGRSLTKLRNTSVFLLILTASAFIKPGRKTCTFTYKRNYAQ